MEKSSLDSPLAPHFALLAVQLMFGSFPVAGKIALQSFPSFTIVGFRVGGAALAFLALQRFNGNLRLEQRGDYWRLALYAALGVTFNQILSITGLSLTTAGNSALLAAMMPVFVAVISAVLGFDKLNWFKAGGILVAASGVIYLINPAQADFSSQHVKGDLMIIINGLCYAAYLSISKDTIARNGALRSLAWLFLFGSIICVPLGAFSISNVDLSQIGANAWLALAYIVLLPTICAYYLNAWALARVSPSIVAVYIYLQPLIGFLLAVLFLGEHFTFKTIIAAALIFAGVFLVTRKIGAEENQPILHNTLP
jgi:drug/metabolite transporter (DMT)-like permease